MRPVTVLPANTVVGVTRRITTTAPLTVEVANTVVSGTTGRKRPMLPLAVLVANTVAGDTLRIAANVPATVEVADTVVGATRLRTTTLPLTVLVALTTSPVNLPGSLIDPDAVLV